MQVAFQFLRESEGLMNSTNFSTPLTLELYDPSIIHRLKTDGYDVDIVLADLNQFLVPNSNGTLAYQALLNVDMNILAQGLSVGQV